MASSPRASLRGLTGVAALWIGLAVACGTVGCTTNGRTDGLSMASNENTVDPARMNERDDIYSVYNFWSNDPWLRDGEHIVGFRVSTRFASTATDKGAFVPGRIFIWIYEPAMNFDGQMERKLLHSWEMSRDEAMGWRITRRTITGLAYYFLMRWPSELNLEGRRIEIEVGYERVRDRRLILGSTKAFDVPLPIGPTSQRARTTIRPSSAKQN